MKISLQYLSSLSGLLALLSGLPTAAQTIAGTVFEDAGYGGGAGRSRSALGSAAVGRPNATVELYDALGNYLRTTSTSASGAYTFAVTPATYNVRVVNSTVSSARTGYTAGLLPVQTYAGADANAPRRVGGQAPEKQDAGTGTAAAITTLLIQGLDPSGGDNTAFVDVVEVLSGASPVSGVVANASFETPSLGTGGGAYAYNVAGGAWTFAGAGIAANGSGFAPPTAPDGSQVAFVQYGGSVQQGLNLPAGTYSVRLQVAQRNCCSGTNNQTLSIQINGVEVGRVQPLSTTGFTSYTTGTFSVSAGAGSLSGLTTAQLVPQSVVSVAVSAAGVSDVDFGYSFDVVTATRDGGQGSVRQFVLNANALANPAASFDQRPFFDGTAGVGTDFPAGQETSVFMIPDGLAHPGLQAGLVNQLTDASGAAATTASRALVSLLGPLPAMTDAATALDGTTQTSLSNSNPVLLGTGGRVGAGSLQNSGAALSKVAGPEVELTVPAGTGAAAVSFQAAGGVLRGVALHGGTQGLNVSGTGSTGMLVEGTVVGTTAFSATLPALPITDFGVQLLNPTGTVQNCLIAYAGNTGLNYSAGSGSTGYVIRNNEFNQNGQLVAGGDAISVGDNGAAGPLLIEGNRIANSNSSGIQFEIGQVSNNTVQLNTIIGNGKGGASTRLEGSGIHYLLRNGTETSTNTDLIYRNLFTSNQSSAVVINYGQRDVHVSQNSIFNNGDGTTGGQGLLPIDYTGPTYYVASTDSEGHARYGQGDGVTPNDGDFIDRQGNTGMDYPVITSITNPGGKLRVQGFIGRASQSGTPNTPLATNSRFGGAVVEIYAANNADNNQNGPIYSDPFNATYNPTVAHGEAQNYVGTFTVLADGTFDYTFPTVASNINNGDIVTGTAYLPGRGTSECGVNQLSTFTVLPVELSAFQAKAVGADAQLDWATASEKNNDYFVVERSADGRLFEAAGTVAGHGTSSQPHQYTLRDARASRFGQQVYYRLRQVDYDGQQNFSSVRAVRFGEAVAGTFSVFPNPTPQYAALDLGAQPASQMCTVTLCDLSGRVLSTLALPGGRVHDLPTAGLSAGTYLVEVRGAGLTSTQRLVKY